MTILYLLPVLVAMAAVYFVAVGGRERRERLQRLQEDLEKAAEVLRDARKETKPPTSRRDDPSDAAKKAWADYDGKIKPLRDECQRIQKEIRREGSARSNLIDRLFTGDPVTREISVSQLCLWTLIVGALIALAGVANGTMSGIVSVVLYLAYVALVFNNVISEDPPHLGIRTVFNKRQPQVYREGRIGLVPLVEGAVGENVQPRDYDSRTLDVTTMDNASLEVEASISWRPDVFLLRVFQSGGEKYVTDQLDEVLGSRARHFFYTVPKWQRVEKDEATKTVRVTEITRIEGMSDVSDPTIIQPWEIALQSQPDLTDELILHLTGDNYAQHELSSNREGVPDGEGLGIRILSVRVKTIRLVGKTKEAADKDAREIAEKRAEVREAATELAIAKQVSDRTGMTMREAYEFVNLMKATREGRGWALPGITQAVELLVREFAKSRWSKSRPAKSARGTTPPTSPEGGQSPPATGG